MHLATTRTCTSLFHSPNSIPLTKQTNTSQLTSKNPHHSSFQAHQFPSPLRSPHPLPAGEPSCFTLPISRIQKFLGFFRCNLKEPKPTSAVSTDFMACLQVLSLLPTSISASSQGSCYLFHSTHIACMNIKPHSKGTLSPLIPFEIISIKTFF